MHEPLPSMPLGSDRSGTLPGPGPVTGEIEKHPDAKQPAPAEEVGTESPRRGHEEASDLKDDWAGCRYGDMCIDTNVFVKMTVAMECPIYGCKYYSRKTLVDGVHGYTEETIRDLARMMRTHCESQPNAHNGRTVYIYTSITAQDWP